MSRKTADGRGWETILYAYVLFLINLILKLEISYKNLSFVFFSDLTEPGFCGNMPYIGNYSL